MNGWGFGGLGGGLVGPLGPSSGLMGSAVSDSHKSPGDDDRNDVLFSFWSG